MFRLRITKAAELWGLGCQGWHVKGLHLCELTCWELKKRKLHWLSHYGEFGVWPLTLEKEESGTTVHIGKRVRSSWKKLRWEQFYLWLFLGLHKLQFVVNEIFFLLLLFVVACWECNNPAQNLVVLLSQCRFCIFFCFITHGPTMQDT